MKTKSFWKRSLIVLSSICIVIYVMMFIIRNATSVVPPGMTAAKVTLGAVSKTAYHEGMFWRWPFCSHPVFVNTKQQISAYESQSIKTSDLQTIGLNCRVIYQINADKVPEIVRNIEPEKIDSVLLFPRVASALQETIGKNSVFLLVTQQEMVREATKYILADLLSADGYIRIKEVLFSNPEFSPQFEKAVEAKMAEGQLLELARIQTLKVEEEAKQMLAKASVDMEILKKKNLILTNPLVIKYEAFKMLQNWNGETPSTLVISGNGEAMPVIPITGSVKH